MYTDKNSTTSSQFCSSRNNLKTAPSGATNLLGKLQKPGTVLSDRLKNLSLNDISSRKKVTPQR